ncbi:MAG TPA: protein kinase [Gaiellaceae bacterium]|nr:protein kinase [Gaiellaceae bacterium]
MAGELIAERYELEELVGKGGMSSVYRAHDRLLERTVAIKLLHEHYSRDDDYVERFRREARSAAQLSHPNIVTVIDRGEADGRQFIVFEYIDGQNLKQLVQRQGRLPVRTALELAIEVGRALAFAHEHGLVHRDVKPQNVLLGNGDVKVTDFGIARSVDVKSGLTQTGTVLGTSEYVAPEQASGQQVDALSDVYSLGVVVYELLAGNPPYSGESFVAVAMRHVHDPVPSIAQVRPDVPLRLDAALAKAMAKRPEDRFPSMTDFVTELEATLAALGTPDADRTTILPPAPAAAPHARRPPRRARARRRSLAPLVALALGLAAIGGGTAAYLALKDDDAGAGGNGSSGGVGVPVHLSASTAYDPPPGDGQEHNDEVARATDGDPVTFWETERYRSLNFGGLKNGVGIILDAGQPVQPREIVVVSDTPGFVAEIKAGAAPRPPFAVVSSSRTVQTRTVFSVSLPQPQQYFLLWITRLAPGYERTHVNEVSAE